MATQRSPRARLEDIIEWGDAVARHIAGKDRKTFAADLMAQHAVMKCIEVIGEASGHLMRLVPDHTSVLAGLDLRTAYAIRNKLSHGYFEIAVDRLWSAASQSVPAIVDAAKAALASFEDGTPNE
jgi:uncharacterized protein with HEPN domain